MFAILLMSITKRWSDGQVGDYMINWIMPKWYYRVCRVGDLKLFFIKPKVSGIMNNKEVQKISNWKWTKWL